MHTWLWMKYKCITKCLMQEEKLWIHESIFKRIKFCLYLTTQVKLNLISLLLSDIYPLIFLQNKTHHISLTLNTSKILLGCLLCEIEYDIYSMNVFIQTIICFFVTSFMYVTIAEKMNNTHKQYFFLQGSKSSYPMWSQRKHFIVCIYIF